MRFGAWMPARMDWGPVVTRADDLGFDDIHQADSQMIYSDSMVALANCARFTDRMRLGCGVTNPLTRTVPVMVGALASLNVLAPGRVFLAIGTGYTAMESMGMSSATVAEMRTFIEQFRALTSGQTTSFSLRSVTRDIRMLNLPGESLDDSFVNLRDHIPILVAAHGPRMLELAGELADGLVLGVVRPTATFMERTRASLERGAARSGRSLENFPIHLMANIYVMADDERFGSDEMKRSVMGLEQSTIGTFAVGRLPRPGAVQKIDDKQIPELYREIVRVQRAVVPIDPDRPWYFQAYDGHGWRLRPELLESVSDELLRARALIGTGDEVLARIREWDSLGITAVGPLLQGSVDLAAEQVERWGRQVIAPYRR